MRGKYADGSYEMFKSLTSSLLGDLDLDLDLLLRRRARLDRERDLWEKNLKSVCHVEYLASGIWKLSAVPVPKKGVAEIPKES